MRVKESEMRYSLSVGELKEGYRLNKDGQSSHQHGKWCFWHEYREAPGKADRRVRRLGMTAV